MTAPFEGTGQKLYRRTRAHIPGGTQLLSKRPEMFLPDAWPAYFSRARGARVWDLDGREYVDMSYNGIGANILGAADPDVDGRVKEAIERGVASTLNAPEEAELAELLFELHPWASMVRYARCGGEAMAMAVRIARSSTGREKIAFCGYHGWHDWYLSANLADDRALDGHLLPGLEPRGVPRGLRGTALPFHYNRLDELEAIVEREKGQLAAIVMEPIRSFEPEPRFLRGVRDIADRIGAVLVFDEVTSGFRVNTGGAHLTLGTRPDIAVFAKAIGNGYAMAAVLGIGSVMDAAQSTFISSTNWTERIGPVAALATIRKHRAERVGDHLVRIGRRVKDGWARAAMSSGLALEVSGLDPLGHFEIKTEDRLAARTLFTKLMLERGYLANASFYATYAHDEATVDTYIATCEEAFQVVSKAIEGRTVRDQIGGPVAHAGFGRLA